MVIAAATVDDVAAWVVLSLALGSRVGLGSLLVPTIGLGAKLGARVALAGAFAAVMIGSSRLVDLALRRVEGVKAGAPGRVVSLVVMLTAGAAACAQALGIHPAFGALLAGFAIRRSPRVKERTRLALQDFVASVFAPIFFAWAVLRVDFAAAFDARLFVLVLATATLTKVLGGAIGARAGGLTWRQGIAVGFGMNARGGMGITLVALAHEAGLLGDRLFVALTGTALVTSLASGPAMKWLLYENEPEEDVVTLLRRGAFVSELHAHTPGDAIAELVRALGSLLAGVKRHARDAVLERELVAPTGLGDGIAIPHAALEGLEQPLLALGRAPHGIDFDAPDGRPARFVFLLLIPANAYAQEIRILASIARATVSSSAREQLGRAAGPDEVIRVLAESAKRTRESMRPKHSAPPPTVD
jgi:mannitol/fructose-specific phosphotransferase system IIA component (Ntr-type)